MAERTDDILVAWVKLHGSNCPAYPVRVKVSDLSIFLEQLDPGDGLLITRPLDPRG